MTTPADSWRSLARAYERDGCMVRGDLVLRRCADELEAWLGAEQSTILSQREAADELGITPQTLRRWEQDGRIKRVGSKAQYRKSDLYAALRREPRDEQTLQLIDARR